jgi:hypothetical protein
MPLEATGCPQLGQSVIDRCLGDMLQLVQVAPDRIGLLPWHGQNVDVARIALTGQSPLDADEQWFWPTVVAASGCQPLQVVADHAFAEAGPLADLTLAWEGYPVVGGAAG